MAPNCAHPGKSQLTRWAVLALATAGIVTACGDDEGGGGGGTAPASTAEQLCASMQDYLEKCGASTPCDQAMVDDCTDLVSILSEDLLESALACIKSSGSPLSCLVGGVSGLQPTETHLAVAAKVCDVCTGGFGVDTCQNAFFSETSEFQIGIVLLPFGDGVVQSIGDSCVTDLLSCGTLLTCAQQTLLAQALPEATAQCLVDNLSNPGAISAPDCTLGGDGGGGPGGAGPGGGGPGGGGAGCDPTGTWMVTETVVQSDCPAPHPQPFTLTVSGSSSALLYNLQYQAAYDCPGSSTTDGGACRGTFSCDFPQGDGFFTVDFTDTALTGSEVYNLTDLDPACFVQYDLAGTRQ